MGGGREGNEEGRNNNFKTSQIKTALVVHLHKSSYPMEMFEKFSCPLSTILMKGCGKSQNKVPSSLKVSRGLFNIPKALRSESSLYMRHAQATSTGCIAGYKYKDLQIKSPSLIGQPKNRKSVHSLIHSHPCT